MLQIKPEQKYVYIGDKLVLHKGETKPLEGRINLYLKRWADTPAFVGDSLLINYPWEYDQQQIYFKVFEVGKDLNYLIGYEGEFLAIVQNQEALEDVEEVDNMDWRIVKGDQLAKKIEELDTWGQIIKIE